MRIISSFKDYYDFVAHKYGGGDPKVVYVRNRLKENQVNVKEPNVPHDDNGFGIIYNIGNRQLTQSWAHLIVAGKMYLLTRPNEFYNQSEQNYAYKVKSPEEAEEIIKLGRPGWKRTSKFNRYGIELPFLVDYCRQVGTPVFIVESNGFKRTLHIKEHIPNLGKMGMASLIPAEQMYQDLAYFMGNTMNPSPDIKPPVEVANKYKILAAGFDLKTSFRNR